ncbi:MAG TPA: VOC family protein [Burkholderiales bacterium]|nr:VOC family protein [Burkholderiales bacterium]
MPPPKKKVPEPAAPLRSLLDHIVITAPTLEAGTEYVQSVLGVAPAGGGEHVAMGTHNRVLKLGAGTYLEVIAVDPAAPPPDRPRWFELDEEESNTAPRLATWVVRTTDITAALAASPVVSGYATPMSRGDFHWTITVPRNGSLPLQGVAPTLIQWQDAHPATAMPDSGCSLVKLEAFHPRAAKVREMLDAIGFQGEFSVTSIPAGETPYLVAHLLTPSGLREISGRPPAA